MASMDLLLWLAVLFPPVWYLCYYITSWEESKLEAALGKYISKITFVEAASTPSVWLFSIYLTVFVTVFESALGWLGGLRLLACKVALGLAMYPISHGVVLYDMPAPRLLFVIYPMLPWSGAILTYREDPISLFTAPFLLLCVAYATYARKRGKGVKKKEEAKPPAELPQPIIPTIGGEPW